MIKNILFRIDPALQIPPKRTRGICSASPLNADVRFAGMIAEDHRTIALLKLARADEEVSPIESRPEPAPA
jgi:hypothetical protein